MSAQVPIARAVSNVSNLSDNLFFLYLINFNFVNGPGTDCK